MSLGDPRDLEALLGFVRHQRGVDLSSYKASTLGRRIARRMDALGVVTWGAYLDRLQTSPQELEPLLETLFINVTGFFRNPEAWEAVRTRIIPELLEHARGRGVRVWCAGVASGQEVYTLAMLLAEAMGREAFLGGAEVFATDIDHGTLAEARAASYDSRDVSEVPRELRDRYFEPAGERFRFRHDLRRTVVFVRHDLLGDAPIQRVHLLVCRNTLMYFNAEAQGRVLTRLHVGLMPRGYLFLGEAERPVAPRGLFVSVDGRAGLFRKAAAPSFGTGGGDAA